MSEGVPDEWALYGALFLFIVTIIAGATPKFLKAFGEVGEALQERLDRQRQAAMRADDADIMERDRVIAYLQGRQDEQQAEIARRDELIRQHLIWDYDMYDAAVQRGERPPHPPPLHTTQES